MARGFTIAITGIAMLAAAAGCGEAKIVHPSKAELVSDATVAIEPATGKSNVPIASEITPGVKDGKLTALSLKGPGGESVAGRLRDDGSSWIPAKPLNYGTKYTAAVTAVDDVHRTVTKKSTFTTMKKPSKEIEPILANEDGKTYGKAMPVALNFPPGFLVPENKRAAVEKRLFVESDPAQQGVWHWFSGDRLQYRPKDFWQPGTTVTVRLGLKGLPLGHSGYGAQDLSARFTIDDTDRELTISNKKKELVASKEGKKVKSMPVSLGKPGYESYSGTMAIMNRLPSTIFDTTNEPGCNGKEGGGDCYRMRVSHAERLTWTGQFIHSAPWSVGDQGYRNVSHGCINLAPGKAKWIYNFIRVGDPVTIKGTGVDLPPGDGFTAFNLDWKDFREGSYLAPAGT